MPEPRDGNERLRSAILRHRDRIKSLGIGQDGQHGGPWDRELWAEVEATASSDVDLARTVLVLVHGYLVEGNPRVAEAVAVDYLNNPAHFDRNVDAEETS